MDDISLRASEQRRCNAIVAGRYDEFADLLADDLTHIHATGYSDDKPGYLAGLRDRLIVRSIGRDPVAIEVLGDVAVMTGSLVNVVRRRDADAWLTGESIVTQLWRYEGPRWRMFLYQATRAKPGGTVR